MRKCSLFLVMFVLSWTMYAQNGTDFWFAAPDIDQAHGDGPIIFHFMAGNTGADVTVSIPAANLLVTTLHVAANSEVTYQWPNSGSLTKDKIENSYPSNAVTQKGIHITSTASISVIYENVGQSPSGGYANMEKWTLKGSKALGKKFYVPSQNVAPNSKNLITKECIIIVASQDSTTVTITPKVTVNGGTHPANTPFAITLNRGETFVVNDDSQVASSSLGGSIVEADKPVAVTIYDASLFDGNSGYDSIGDQIVPVDYIDKEYVVIKSNGVNNDVACIVTTQPNTSISQDGASVGSYAAAGSFFGLTVSNNVSYIKADKPIYLYHLSQDGNEYGAALLLGLSTGTREAVLPVSSIYTKETLMMVVLTSATSKFTINGASFSPWFAPIAGTSPSLSYTKYDMMTAGYPNGSTYVIANSASDFHLGTLTVIPGTSDYSYQGEIAKLNLGPDITTCQGASVTLDAGALVNPTMLQWYFNGTLVQTGGRTFNTSSEGTYRVESTNIGLLSKVSDEVIVTFAPLSVSITTAENSGTSANDGIVCAGDMITITASGATTYQWNQGITNGISFTPTAGATYTVSATNSQGCSTTSSIAITVNNKPTVGASSSQASVCVGQPVTLKGTGANTYSWDNNVTDGSAFTPGTTQSYTVTGTDMNGCTNTTSTTVVVNHPTPIDLGNDTTICPANNESITFNATIPNGVLYTWNDNSHNPTYTSNKAETVSVTVDNGQCLSRDSVVVASYCSEGLEPGIIGNNQYACNGQNPLLLEEVSPSTVRNGVFLQWEYSTDSTTWQDIAGATQLTYQPPNISSNTWYRRAITDTNAHDFLINSGFEYPETPSLGNLDYMQVTYSEVGKWKKSPEDELIEIWKSGYNGVVAPQGNQFIELSAQTKARLYQDIVLKQGQTIHWSFMHRGRTGTDVAHLSLFSQNGSELITLETPVTSTSWQKYTGSWSVNFPDNTYQVGFLPISSSTGNIDQGNLLDDIKIWISNTAKTSTVHSNSVKISYQHTTEATVSNVRYCQNALPVQLSAGGTSLKWYDTFSSTSPLDLAPTPSTQKAGITTYYVSQTINGCESSKSSLTVTVNASPTVTTTDTTVCRGTSLTLKRSGALAYQWNQGLTDNNPFVANASAEYIVTGTDTNNCTSSDTARVTVIAAPQLSWDNSTDSVFCQGDSSSIILATLATTETFDYTWRNTANLASQLPSDSSSIAGIGAGTYRLEVSKTSNNVTCKQVLADRTVVGHPRPSYHVGGGDTVCDGNIPKPVTVTINKGTPSYHVYYHVWGTSSRDTVIEGINPVVFPIKQKTHGQYIVDSVVDTHGCITRDSTQKSRITIYSSYRDTINRTIAYGDTTSLGDIFFSKSGIYTRVFKSRMGCDSVVTLILTVLQKPIFTKQTSATACGSYVFAGKTLTASGMYNDTTRYKLTDTVVALSLTINPIQSSKKLAEIPYGSTYVFGNETLSKSGSYTKTFQSANGCDSIVTLTLNVLPKETITKNLVVTACGSYVLGNNTITQSGIYTDTLRNKTTGIDTVIIVNLTVHETYSDTTTKDIAHGTNYTFYGVTYATSGVFVKKEKSVYGCDSLHVLVLHILPKPVTSKNISVTACGNYTFGSRLLTQSGEYRDTASYDGSPSDTVTILSLTIHPTYHMSVSKTVGFGQTYIFGDTTLASNGTYTRTFTSTRTCDSTVVLDFVVLPKEILTKTVNDTACGYYVFAHDTLHQSGEYHDSSQLATTNTVTILKLVVNPVYSITTTAEVAYGSSYTFGNDVLSRSGTYTHTFSTTEGCDSVVTLGLTVMQKPVFTRSVSKTACNSYSFAGKNITSSGVYRDTIKTTISDTITILTLTIQNTYNITTSNEIFVGETYQFGDTTLAKTGTYRRVLHSSEGCDSIVTLTLTIIPRYKTVNVAVPGTLSSLLTQAEKDTLSGIIITGTIDSLDFYTLRNMPKLSYLNMSKVTTKGNRIPSSAFNYNTSLTIIKLPSTATAIGQGAFEGCVVLPTVTIPPSVTIIEDYAFNNCNNLSNIIIPPSVVHIGISAFANCLNLLPVTLPALVSHVGVSAFYASANAIYVDHANQYFVDIEGVLYNKDTTTLIQYPTARKGSFAIPSTVSSIATSAFKNCTGLTAVSIPSSATSIGASAFASCTGLTSISIPAGVRSIGNNAFTGCSGLTSVSLFPQESVIGRLAFSGCTSISTVYTYARTPIDLTYAFNVFDASIQKSGVLSVPTSTKTAYSTAIQWKNFANIVEREGLFVSDSVVNISCLPNSQGSVRITANVTWFVSSNRPWLTVNKTIGKDNDILVMTASENVLNSEREATITLSSKGLPDVSVKVIQALQKRVIITSLSSQSCGSHVFFGRKLSSSGIYSDTLRYPKTDSITLLNLTVYPVYDLSIDSVIHQGDTCLLGDTALVSTGIYTRTFKSISGCDSTIHLSLTVIPRVIKAVSITHCGEYLFAGKRLTTSGTYTDTASYATADTVTVLTLTIKKLYQGIKHHEIGYGTTFEFGDTVLSTSGSFTKTFTGAEGCDSTVTLVLNVLPKPVATKPVDVSSCESFVFGTKNLTTSGIYHDTARYAYSDTITVLTLTIYPRYRGSIDSSIAYGTSFTMGDTVLTSSGIYNRTLVGSKGCDSIITLDLTVLPKPVATKSISATACGSYTFAGHSITSSGEYRDTIIYPLTDTITILSLRIDPVYTISTTREVAYGKSFEFGDTVLSTPGTYTKTFATEEGCDSIVTLVFNVLPKEIISKSISVTSCQSYWFGGRSISTSGVYTDTTRGADTDSVTILSLTISPVYSKTDSKTVAYGSTYVFGDTTLAHDGQYTRVFRSKEGCDSTVTLTLTVLPKEVVTKTVEVTACGSYTFAGSRIDSSGIYRNTINYTLTDTTTVLHLSLNPVYNTSVTTILDPGKSLMFGKDLLTKSGVYTTTFTSMTGCDSTVTLNLTVKETVMLYDSSMKWACDSYLYKGFTLTKTGVYHDTIPGIDTTRISVLLLTINPSFAIASNKVVAYGKTYLFGDTILATSGTYTRTFKTTIGCDSTVTLAFNVMPKYRTVHVSTPGTLASLLTKADRDTVTMLVVTGTIDSLDFYTLRDKMPNLRYIDMSSATAKYNRIPLQAFDGKTSLDSIALPRSITQIADWAFSYCTNLSTMTIPPSVTHIGSNAFTKCSGLQSIEIPPLVTALNPNTFANCTSLTSVTFSGNITTIGASTFAGCTSLTSISLPTTVTAIGTAAFAGCTGLTSFAIPASVTRLEDRVFENCSRLSTIAIPPSIKSIGNKAFNLCVELSSIQVFTSTPLPIGSSFFVFDGVNKATCTLFVPTNAKPAYEKASRWKDFAHIVEQNYIICSDSVVDLSSAPQSASITITANVAWTLSSDQAWLKISKSSGKGNNIIVLSCEENLQIVGREAHVTINDTDGVTPKTILIRQASSKPSLQVPSPNVTLASSVVKNRVVKVISNTTFTASTDKSWLTVTIENGSILLSATENIAFAQRTATVSVMVKGIAPATITVTQSANKAFITVSSNTLTFTPSTTYLSVDISTNVTFTARVDKDWASVLIENNKLIISTDANLDGHERTAVITVTGDGGVSQSINLTQLVSTDASVTDGSTMLIYPNPTSRTIWVKGFNGTAHLVVQSANAGIVLETTVHEGQSIDIQDLTPGVYLVSLQTHQQIFTCKLVKE